jgi:hypothetical protein
MTLQHGQIDLRQIAELMEAALAKTDRVHMALESEKAVAQELEPDEFSELVEFTEISTCRIGSYEVSFDELVEFLKNLSRLKIIKRSKGWDGALEILYESAKPMTNTAVCLTTDKKLR